MFIQPIAERDLRLVERRSEIRSESELFGLVVRERKLDRGKFEEEIERVAVERFDFEFGANVQRRSALPKMGPNERVVLRIARLDQARLRRNVEREAAQ